MSSVNKAIIVGNLGKDPEVRTFQNGSKVASFSVACSETWKDKNTGEKKDKTEWINVAIFNDGLVRVAETYLRKGSKVYLEGKIQTRKWQDKDGNDRYSTEVVLQGFNASLVMLDGPSRSDAQESPRRAEPAQGNLPDALNDDIPFSFEWRG